MTNTANTDEIMATVARLEALLAKAPEFHARTTEDLLGSINDQGHLIPQYVAGVFVPHWRNVWDLLIEARVALPALLAAIRALTANLQEHGEHIPSCPSRGDVPGHADCDCGLARALKGFGVGC